MKRKKIDLNRLRLLDVSVNDRQLLEKYVRGEFLTEDEIKKVYFLDAPDINDRDFEAVDIEDKMYFIAENNQVWFQKLKGFEEKNDKNFLEILEKELEKARELAKQEEEIQIEKFFAKKQKKETLQTLTLRVFENDFLFLKNYAEKNNMKYQTLMRDFIHKWVLELKK